MKKKSNKKQICKCGHSIDLHLESVLGKCIAGECSQCECKKYSQQETQAKGESPTSLVSEPTDGIFNRKEYMKQWRLNNKDNINEFHRKWSKNNKDKIDKYHNNYAFGGNRFKVLERDNWTCQECGMTNNQHLINFGRLITIHHKDKKGRNRAHKNNSLSNLITLCVKCHNKSDGLFNNLKKKQLKDEQ